MSAIASTSRGKPSSCASTFAVPPGQTARGGRPAHHGLERLVHGAVAAVHDDGVHAGGERVLAAAGRHDEEIAEILNADGMRTGRGLTWNTWAVRWTRKTERICRVAPDRPRRELLPDQFPDGRYSVAGAATRFGVTMDVIRAWVRRGLVPGERNDFQAHRRVWWLQIPEDTAARLEHLAAPLLRP